MVMQTDMTAHVLSRRRNHKFIVTPNIDNQTGLRKSRVILTPATHTTIFLDCARLDNHAVKQTCLTPKVHPRQTHLTP